MKKSILNEINEMKYMFGYKRGVVISEQATGDTKDFKTELISQGYKDITKWFLGPDGVVYIPDGEYIGIGDENYIRIKTPQEVDTGYVLFWEEPMNTRGGTPTDVKIENNGFTIRVKGKFNSIMLNQDTLDKSGLKKN